MSVRFPVLFLLLAAVPTSVEAQVSWVSMNGPPSGPVNGLATDGAGNLYADVPNVVIDGGSRLFVSDDSGETWRIAEFGAGGRMSLVSTAGGGIVVGWGWSSRPGESGCGLLRATYWSDDGDESIEFLGPGDRSVFSLLHVGGDTVLAGRTRGVVRSVDGGLTWQSYRPGQAYTCGTSDQEALDSLIFPLDSLSVYAMAAHGGRVYAGTSSGIYVSDDRGDRWAHHSLKDVSVSDLEFDREGRLLAASFNRVHALENGTWTTDDVPGTRGLTILDDGSVFAHGQELLRLTSNGWKPFPRPPALQPETSWINDAVHIGNVLFVATGEGVWRLDSASGDWELVGVPGGSVRDLLSRADGSIWAATWYGAFRLEVETWQRVSDLPAVGALVETTEYIVAAGQDRKDTFTSRDGGESFQRMNEGLGSQWGDPSLCATSNGTVVLLSGGSAFVLEPGALNWKPIAEESEDGELIHLACTSETAYTSDEKGILELAPDPPRWVRRTATRGVEALAATENHLFVVAFGIVQQIHEAPTLDPPPPLLPANVQVTTLAISPGEQPFVGTANSGVLTLNEIRDGWIEPGDLFPRPFEEAGGRDPVTALQVGRDGRLYAGTIWNGLVATSAPVVAVSAERPIDQPQRARLFVFPIPSLNDVHVELDLPDAAQVMVEVFDLLGRRVSQLREGIVASGRLELVWHADTVAAGVYVIRVRVGEQVLSKAVVVR